jgi:predicted methyltransferase
LAVRRPFAAAVLTALLAGAPGLTAPFAAQRPPDPGRAQLFPPIDLGLLEPPDRDAWQQPDQIMDALGVAGGSIVADIGAGAGWFTVRLGKRVGPAGLVYAQDVQRPVLDAIRRRTEKEHLRNVRTRLGMGDNPNLPANALDAILIVDVYPEVEDRFAFLSTLGRSLKPAGRMGIVNYKPGDGGPGPVARLGEGQRVAQAVVERDVVAAGLVLVPVPQFLPYQYLVIATRPPAKTR